VEGLQEVLSPKKLIAKLIYINYDIIYFIIILCQRNMKLFHPISCFIHAVFVHVVIVNDRTEYYSNGWVLLIEFLSINKFQSSNVRRQK
jgi:hypothetical protein